MAARKRRVTLNDHWRTKIQTSMLVNRLNDNAMGKLELTAVQQKSIEILLRKTIPDLSSVEQRIEGTINHIARLPQPQPRIEEWREQHTDLLPPLPPKLQ